jgi:hypothetical protein
LDEAPYKLSRAVAKLASITFWSIVFFLLDWLPWFLTEGKTCCYIHHTFILGFPNWPVIYFITTAPSRERKASCTCLLDMSCRTIYNHYSLPCTRDALDRPPRIGSQLCYLYLALVWRKILVFSLHLIKECQRVLHVMVICVMFESCL